MIFCVGRLTKWTAAAALAATPSLAPAAGQTCAATQDQLLGAIRTVHEKQKNVGVQAAIQLDGRLVFSSALGLADRERNLPVTRNTVFPVASITKAFTGVAALKAQAAGKLRLDEPIQGYVPEFPVKPELVVTPRRLAAHFAGLRHWGPEREGLFSRRFDRLQHILPLFKDDPLLAKAGREYQYSSYGYNLLGLAVERATGTEFTRYVDRQILTPLRLTRTRFDNARKAVPGRTNLYSYYELKDYAELAEPIRVPARDYSHNMAGGNMSSTAEDLVRFGSALLRPGLLPTEQYELLYTQPRFDGEASPMTFGFFTGDPGTERRLSISGANPGVQAALRVYPERNLVVALLSNTWGIGSREGEMTDLTKKLADLCVPPKAEAAPPAPAR